MREKLEQRLSDVGPMSAWSRVRLLPRQVVLLALVLFLAALAPAVAEVAAALGPAGGPRWLVVLAGHPGLVQGLSGAVAVGAILVMERPRGRSPVAYARQLRERFTRIQSNFDGALRRRARGDEEERHVPEPHPPEP